MKGEAIITPSAVRDWLLKTLNEALGEPQSLPTEYNRTTCITARQLRDARVPVPAEIPGAAWIPCAAIEYKTGEAHVEAADQVRCSIDVTFKTQFRWLEAHIERTADGNAPCVVALNQVG